MSTMMSPKTCFDIGTRCNAKEQGQISSGPALIFIGLYLWILPHDFYILRRVLSRWKPMEWHLVRSQRNWYFQRTKYHSSWSLLNRLPPSRDSDKPNISLFDCCPISIFYIHIAPLSLIWRDIHFPRIPILILHYWHFLGDLFLRKAPARMRGLSRTEL